MFKEGNNTFTFQLPRILFFILVLCCAETARGAKTSSEVAQRCEQGLHLHGRGQWRAALDVFAVAVGDAISNDLASGVQGEFSELSRDGFKSQLDRRLA